MLAVRVISRQHHLDHDLNRVNRLAFKNTGDNPRISVIDEECVNSIGNTICEHIKKYYTKTAGGEPPIFWQFSSGILPPHSLDHEDSGTGDIWCHYSIRGVSDTQARNILKQYWGDLNNFRICDNAEHRTLAQADVNLLPRRSYPPKKYSNFIAILYSSTKV